MNEKVNYLITYRCNLCGNDSSFSESDEASCRYCDTPSIMTMISKQEATPQLMEERIKALSESMLSNLQQAYQNLSAEDMANFPAEKDPEKELLLLLAKLKNLKEKIDGIQFSGNNDMPPEKE
jgi:DNA-directed RNA polymerase subunit RPC12/RpoP